MFIIKLVQGDHRPLYLRRDYPTVAWSVRERAKEFLSKGEAARAADRLRTYGTVMVIPAREPS